MCELGIGRAPDGQRERLLPIETAMKLAAQKWQNPVAGRADLNARLQKANAPVKAESFE